MNTNTQKILAIIAVLLAIAAGAFFLGKMQGSGKIDSSDGSASLAQINTTIIPNIRRHRESFFDNNQCFAWEEELGKDGVWREVEGSRRSGIWSRDEEDEDYCAYRIQLPTQDNRLINTRNAPFNTTTDIQLNTSNTLMR